MSARSEPGVGCRLRPPRGGRDALAASGLTLGELASALRASRDLPTALDHLGARGGAWGGAWRVVLGATTGDGRLAPALASAGHPFGSLVSETVEAGERSGRLAEACAEAREALEARAPLTIRALLLTSSLWSDLPLYAVPVLLLALLVGLLAAAGCALVLLRGGSPRTVWHALRRRLPLVGALHVATTQGRFAQVLAASTRVGVPIARALEMASSASGDRALEAELAPSTRALRRGAGLSESLAGCHSLAPAVRDLLATAERTGRWDVAAERIAEHLRDEAEEAVDRLAATASWLLPVLLGVAVLAVAIFFYSAHAPDGMPSFGELWHNLLHGPDEGPRH